MITSHWFREGSSSDPSLAYWMCGICGEHRGQHLQAEGAWLKRLHTFTAKRVHPTHCRICGRRQRHTVHTPWRWDQLDRG